MLRHYDNKNTKRDENMTDKVNKDKQNKPGLVRSDSALRMKSNIYVEDSHNKSQKKESMIPLKRNDSSLSPIDFTSTKRQNTRVETTIRHKEEESEWSPPDIDLTFDEFNTTVDDGYFNKISEQEIKHKLIPINTTEVIKEPIQEEYDISTVEYAHLTEQEIPYVPTDEYAVDMSLFSPYVDITPYEINRLFKDEYSLLDDMNELKEFQVHLTESALDFYYEEEQESSDDDLPDIPFNDHCFDIHHYTHTVFI